jgi:hypothetical protein
MDSPSKLLQNLILAAEKFAYLLMVLPLGAVIGYLHLKHQRLKELSSNIEILESRAKELKSAHGKQERRWSVVQKSPPHYLAEVVEPLPLLSSEERRLTALARQYPDNRLIHNRLLFVQGEKNTIQFVEEMQRAGPFFQERDLAMHHPVQLNRHDLKTFLNLLEEPTTPKPLFIIKSFDLKKEELDEPIYTLLVNLIERSP